MQTVLNNNIYENCFGATMRSILPIVESKENVMIFYVLGMNGKWPIYVTS